MTRGAILADMSFSDPAALARLLDQSLTPAQKQYITLYYDAGLTMREIAHSCGVSHSTVSRTIARGTRRIRRAAELSSLIKPRRERLC